MSDHTREHARVREQYPSRGLIETPLSRGKDRAEALRALTMDRTVVYAMRLRDGLIKIGCSSQVWHRRAVLSGELLAFRFGDFDDEAAIHASLKQHRARGHEFYHPTAEVMAVVNAMRDDWNLPHIAR